MPRVTRRHFLAASLGLPALLLTCGPPEETAVKPVPPPAPQAFSHPPSFEDVVRSVPAPVAAPVVRDPVELWHFAWDDPLERRLWFAIRQQLEMDLPHLRLRQEFYQRPVEEAVAVAAAAGLPPEVALIQDTCFPHWVERNLYVNIQAFVNRSLGDDVASDKPAAALRAFRYYPEARRPGLGDYYSLPWRQNPRFLFINVGMLRQNGLAALPARERWTLETVQKAALGLTQGGPDNRVVQGGIGFPDSWFQSLPWLWSGGGDVLDVDSNVSTLALPEVENTYQTLQDWRHSTRLAPRPESLSSDTYVQQFATHRLAMFLGNAGDMFRLRSADVAWQARSLFPVGAGESRTLATYEGLAIITGAQQIDAAWEFVTWAMRPEVQEHVLASESALPVLASVIASSQVESHYSDTLLRGLDSQRSLPIAATFPLYNPVIAHYYRKMMNGEHAPVTETLSELHSLLGFILERQTLPNQW